MNDSREDATCSSQTSGSLCKDQTKRTPPCDITIETVVNATPTSPPVGVAATNKSAVRRSGAGIRSNGSVVWAGGDGFTVETLAETLVRAGAVRGMQLDINQEWVQLNTYGVGSDGTVHGRRLLHGMQHAGDRWLTADTRDFIAVFTR